MRVRRLGRAHRDVGGSEIVFRLHEFSIALLKNFRNSLDIVEKLSKRIGLDIQILIVSLSNSYRQHKSLLGYFYEQ